MTSFQGRKAHPNSRFKTIGESILFGVAGVAATADHIKGRADATAALATTTTTTQMNGKQQTHPGKI